MTTYHCTACDSDALFDSALVHVMWCPYTDKTDTTLITSRPFHAWLASVCYHYVCRITYHSQGGYDYSFLIKLPKVNVFGYNYFIHTTHFYNSNWELRFLLMEHSGLYCRCL